MTAPCRPPRAAAHPALRPIAAPRSIPAPNNVLSGFESSWRVEWDAMPRFWPWHTYPLDMRCDWVRQLVVRVAENVLMDTVQAIELERRLHIERNVASHNEEAVKYGQTAEARAIEGVASRPPNRWEEWNHPVPTPRELVRHPRTTVPALARHVLERIQRWRDNRNLARVAKRRTPYKLEVANIPVSQAGYFVHAHHVHRSAFVAAALHWFDRQRAVDLRTVS